MVKLQLNLDEIGTTRTVVDAGRYKAKVTEIEEGESQSGNPMLTWTWELVDGDFAGAELRSYTSLQEHALFGLKNHLEAFGYEGEVDVDTSKIVGKTAILVVSKKTIPNPKTDEPMEVNRIENVLSAGAQASAKTPIVQKGSGKGVAPQKGGKGKVPF